MKVAPFITRVATAIKWKQAQPRRIGAAGGRRKAAEVAGRLPNMPGQRPDERPDERPEEMTNGGGGEPASRR